METYHPVLIYAAIMVGFVIANLIVIHVVGPRKKTAVKQMPYESGMDPVGTARMQFDVKFYLIAILFLVFDVELLFLYPWAAIAYGEGGDAWKAAFGRVVFLEILVFMVDVLHNVCQFFAHESCGQCTPCREGTGWMEKIADRMRRGKGNREDLDILVDVADSIGIMPGTTICGLADGAGWPVKTAIRKFREEFEEVIAKGEKSKYARELAVVH